MTSDEAFVEGALRRIERNTIWLGAAGAVAVTMGWGWTAGVGFAAGAAGSYFNFRWLKQVVGALSGATRPSKWRAVLFGLRYLLFGVLLYVIVKFFAIKLVAALCGFLAAVGAVLLEILYELTHART
jgi:hypothetical protein